MNEPTTTATIRATAVAIEDAERRLRVAVDELHELVVNGELDRNEAVELEAQLLARHVTRAVEIEQHGHDACGRAGLARHERTAARRRACADEELRRAPLLRGRTPRGRMAVVASGRVEDLALPLGDEDEEILATRAALAGAGLL